MSILTVRSFPFSGGFSWINLNSLPRASTSIIRFPGEPLSELSKSFSMPHCPTNVSGGTSLNSAFFVCSGVSFPRYPIKCEPISAKIYSLLTSTSMMRPGKSERRASMKATSSRERPFFSRTGTKGLISASCIFFRISWGGTCKNSESGSTFRVSNSSAMSET